MKLRSWFLLPTVVWMAVLFAAPFAIVLAYSLMTRGDIGGIEMRRGRRRATSGCSIRCT